MPTATATEPIHWPEEGEPEFVSDDWGETWHPLCRCGRRLERSPRSVLWACPTNWHNRDHRLVMLFPEDWPDYEEDEEDEGDEPPRPAEAQTGTTEAP